MTPQSVGLVRAERRLVEEFYNCPLHVNAGLILAPFLRKKYQGLKVELNRLKVRVSDVTKSRDNWRQQAEAADQQVHAMKAEVERLAALLEQASDSDSQKK